jgi:tetratricopeptide (TPR) repeat protein
LKLLTGGARDLPTRHQTLRGTIQWSYDLLPPAEQMLFRRLSVFRGGCSLEAIEAVCNADGALTIDVLDGVASLADKSLVRQESAAGDEARIFMLDTIREYAMELLHQSGEQEAQLLYRQHALYYLMLAEQAEVALRGPEHILWLERLEVEHDNLRAAFEWAFDHAEAELALDLVGTLWHFWETRGYASEAIQWVDTALSLPGAEECTLARAKALMVASASAWFKYDVVSARRYAEESAAILRKEQSDPAAIFYLAGALLFLGISIGYSSTNVEDYKRGREITDEALEIAKATGDRWIQATGMLDMGLLENRWGRYPEARKALEKGLMLYRQVRDKWGLAQVLNVLGDIERIAGQYDRAGELYEESLTLYRELNARPDIPASLHNLGYVALALGDAQRAANLFIESLRLHLELLNRHGVTECLAGLAGVAGALGQPRQAARLFGASDALREALDAIMWPAERADYERNLSAARARVDDATWQAAYAEGRAMSMEQAVAYAQEAGHVQSDAT